MNKKEVNDKIEASKEPITPELNLNKEKKKIKEYVTKRKLLFVFGDFFEYYNGYYQKIPDFRFKQQLFNHIENENFNNSQQENILKGCRIVAQVSEKEVNHQRYMNLENGIFDLQKYELIEHTEKIKSINRIPIVYKKEAAIDEFQTFLDSSIPDKTCQKALQEYLGYCLSPDTEYHKALFLIGNGANGKGVLTKIVQQLIGQNNISYLDIADLGKAINRAHLSGKLVNISTEMSNKITARDYKIFKQVTAFEEVIGKFLYFDNFAFTPYAKFIFAVNEKPVFPENNKATFRRLLLIYFPHSFGSAEEGDDFDADVHLYEKLKKELPGIFNWAIQGLKRLRKNEEFSKSALMEKEMEEMRIRLDPITEFTDKKCTFDPESNTSISKIYGSYKKFCEKHGEATKSRQVFGKEILKKPGVDSKRVTRNGQKTTMYYGIGC